MSDGVVFTVWAPAQREVAARAGSEDQTSRWTPAGAGYFSATAPDVPAGQRYWFRLEQGLRPDPVSRFQPDGPFGPSMVVDPRAFTWTTSGWEGAQPRHRQVVYEMHIGTFTTGGTWASARERLPHLASLGITTLEVMPIAEFDGRFGWGYDGVFLFAPYHRYGTPDDARAFVDAAHGSRPRPSFSTSSTTTSVRRATFCRSSARRTSPRTRRSGGSGFNLDGECSAPGAPFHARERAALARGVSLRRPSLRRDAGARRSHHRRTSSRS